MASTAWRGALLWAAAALLGAGVLGAETPAVAGPPAALGWNLDAIHVAQAHRMTRGAGVVVAVLDTGVDVRHPRLGGSVFAGADLVDGAPGPMTSTGTVPMSRASSRRGRSPEAACSGSRPRRG